MCEAGDGRRGGLEHTRVDPENMPSTLAVTRVCTSIHSQLIYPRTLLPAISGNYRVKSGSSMTWRLCQMTRKEWKLAFIEYLQITWHILVFA